MKRFLLIFIYLSITGCFGDKIPPEPKTLEDAAKVISSITGCKWFDNIIEEADQAVGSRVCVTTKRFKNSDINDTYFVDNYNSDELFSFHFFNPELEGFNPTEEDSELAQMHLSEFSIAREDLLKILEKLGFDSIEAELALDKRQSYSNTYFTVGGNFFEELLNFGQSGFILIEQEQLTSYSERAASAYGVEKTRLREERRQREEREAAERAERQRLEAAQRAEQAKREAEERALISAQLSAGHDDFRYLVYGGSKNRHRISDYQLGVFESLFIRNDLFFNDNWLYRDFIGLYKRLRYQSIVAGGIPDSEELAIGALESPEKASDLLNVYGLNELDPALRSYHASSKFDKASKQGSLKTELVNTIQQKTGNFQKTDLILPIYFNLKMKYDFDGQIFHPIIKNSVVSYQSITRSEQRTKEPNVLELLDRQSVTSLVHNLSKTEIPMIVSEAGPFSKEYGYRESRSPDDEFNFETLVFFKPEEISHGAATVKGLPGSQAKYSNFEDNDYVQEVWRAACILMIPYEEQRYKKRRWQQTRYRIFPIAESKDIEPCKVFADFQDSYARSF